MCEICSKLTIKTPERRNFEHEIAGWEGFYGIVFVSRFTLFFYNFFSVGFSDFNET